MVKHDHSKVGDSYSYWKAKVLEVRALDREHVYLRVVWLNRPEDLPAGRQRHHEVDELIPSNEMDVVDAKSVEGPAEVIEWSKRPGDKASSISARPQYYWRHTYNYKSKQFNPTSTAAEIASGAT